MNHSRASRKLPLTLPESEFKIKAAVSKYKVKGQTRIQELEMAGSSTGPDR